MTSTASASSTALLQIVRNECLPVEDFLRSHTAYDLLPESGKLVVIDIGITVSSAFQAFIENNITSAPLYDSRRHEYVGMLTLLDFMEIFVDFYTVIPKEDFLLCFEIVTLREWRRSKRQQKATLRSDGGHEAAAAQAPLIFVHPEASLFDSSRVLLQHRIHRGPVLDTETNTVLHVFNHARILGYLVTNWRYDTRILNRTMRELNIGTFTGILTTSESTSVIDILRFFTSITN